MDEPKPKKRNKSKHPHHATTKPVSENQKMRKCLKCGEMFLSDGPGNRLCGCKGAYAGVPFAIRH